MNIVGNSQRFAIVVDKRKRSYKVKTVKDLLSLWIKEKEATKRLAPWFKGVRGKDTLRCKGVCGTTNWIIVVGMKKPEQGGSKKKLQTKEVEKIKC